MRSVLERGPDVVPRRLAILYVKRSRLEENISLRRGKPSADVRVWRRFVWRGHSCPRKAGDAIRIQGENSSGLQSGSIRNPPQPPRSYSGDPPRNPVALPQFLPPILKQAEQRPVNISQAEQTKIVSANENS